MTQRCARLKSQYALTAWLIALAMSCGHVLAQDANPPALKGSFGADSVPYLVSGDSAGAPVAVSPFESLLFSHNPGSVRAGSSWSGSWFGSEQFDWRINAHRQTSALGASCYSTGSAVAALGPCAGSQSAGFGVQSVWQPLDGLRLGLGYRQQGTDGARSVAAMPLATSAFSPGWYANSRAIASEGLDLNMAYGFDAGFIGQLQFEFRLSQELNRSLDLNKQPLLAPGSGLESPLTHARLGFNWHHGDFSGSLSSRYVDSILFNGQMLPASWTTVDINFAWQTPWDGSLSVGAKNLLGVEPTEADLGADIFPPQFDDAFGSIPYVRYEQDL